MKFEQAIRVLYIDDEENNLKSFKANFRRDFEIYTAISAEAAALLMKTNEIDIIISDQRMPNMTGVEFFNSILDTHPDPIRILITGYADIEAVINAINRGQVYKYITKPWNEFELKILIEKSFEVLSLRKQNKKLITELEDANGKLEFMSRQKLIS